MRAAAIISSALASTKIVIDKVFSDYSSTSLLAFTGLSVFTTIVVGLEAAFKFDKRAVELNTLAASTQATAIEVDSTWRQTIGSNDEDNPVEAARALLKLQDSKLADIHHKAAASGINVTLDVRELEPPDHAPYAA
jgi:hypothetical protein